MIKYLCISLRIIGLVWLTRLVLLAMGEVLSFGFNLAVSLQVNMKGLTTPLLRWVLVFDCLCRCIDWRLACTSYWIDTLVLKLREILISTLLHHPFLFKGKTNASSRSSMHQYLLQDLEQEKERELVIYKIFYQTNTRA